MDVVFKIAGFMMLIILGLVALLALINAWPDITLAISNFFSDSLEEDSAEEKEAKKVTPPDNPEDVRKKKIREDLAKAREELAQEEWRVNHSPLRS